MWREYPTNGKGNIFAKLQILSFRVLLCISQFKGEIQQATVDNRE